MEKKEIKKIIESTVYAQARLTQLAKRLSIILSCTKDTVIWTESDNPENELTEQALKLDLSYIQANVDDMRCALDFIDEQLKDVSKDIGKMI